MNQAEARLLAKHVAANYVRGALEAGAEIESYTDGDPDSADTKRLCSAINELVDRLDREGAGPRTLEARRQRRQRRAH